jgi:hypothetical protein
VTDTRPSRSPGFKEKCAPGCLACALLLDVGETVVEWRHERKASQEAVDAATASMGKRAATRPVGLRLLKSANYGEGEMIPHPFTRQRDTAKPSLG